MTDRYVVVTDSPRVSLVQPARLYRLSDDWGVLAGQGTADQMKTLADELNGATDA